MKAITLTQPWATLVAIGAKRIETRSWFTKYRGPIAIHAAKGFPGSAKAICEQPAFLDALGWPHPVEGKLQEWMDAIAANLKALPRGEVIATAMLVDCLNTGYLYAFGGNLTEKERTFGDYSPGRFGFLLEDIKQITPMPAKGMLGLWEWGEASVPGGTV